MRENGSHLSPIGQAASLEREGRAGPKKETVSQSLNPPLSKNTLHSFSKSYASRAVRPLLCSIGDFVAPSIPYRRARMSSKAGISVWASQKEKTSLGPVMRSWIRGKGTGLVSGDQRGRGRGRGVRAHEG